MKEVLLKTPVHLFFNSMAVNLNADKAADTELAIKVTFSDLDQSYLLTLKNSVLHHKAVAKDTIADATLTLTQPLFVDMIVGHAGIKDTLFGDDLTVDGSVLDLVKFFSLIEKPEGTFNIVTP